MVAGLVAGLPVAHAQSTGSPALAPAGAAGDGVRLALSSDGRFGAVLVTAPTEHVRPADEEHLAPRARHRDVARGVGASGPIDLAAALGAKAAIARAYAGGVLHVEQAGRYTLLVGADDGAERVRRRQAGASSRDEGRPQRDDDDLDPAGPDGGGSRRGARPSPARGGMDAAGRACSTTSCSPRRARRGCCRGRARTWPRRWRPACRACTSIAGWGPTATTLRLSVRSRRARRAACPCRCTRGSRACPGRAGRAALFDVGAGELGAGRARHRRGVASPCPTSTAYEVEDDDWTLHVDVAGRAWTCRSIRGTVVREAIAHADRALATMPDESVAVPARPARWPGRKGDGDVDAQLDDARELDELASPLDERKDPWAEPHGPDAPRLPLAGRRQALRVRALRAPRLRSRRSSTRSSSRCTA